MLWADATQYPYESGSLFLGRADGQDVGIKTERHALTIAGAGAGKGAAVIIPNLLKWPHNALIIDPKGEAAEATAQARADMGQAVYVVDPFGSANVSDAFRATYNPLDEIDPDALTVREDIETISDGIVMRSDAKASHWDDGAQSIISGLIAYVITTGDEGKRNLLEVRRLLADEDALAVAMQAMKGMDACAGLCREAYAAADAQEGGYFVSNAQKNTRWLDSRGIATALATSSFTLADLKAGKTSVFLVLPANYLGQHGRFLRLFVRCGIEAMARKLPSGALRGEQCLFLLDEFFSLGYIDEISKAAGLMRGYGLQLWPILQDLGQLVTLYGREGSETFFGNADVHQFFGNTDQLTLEQISKRLGVYNLDDLRVPPDYQDSDDWRELKRMESEGIKTVGQAENMRMQAQLAKQVYDNKLSVYQTEASRTLGKLRLTPDQVANLIRKGQGDIVARNQISFVYGLEPVLCRLAPYFIVNDEETENEETDDDDEIIPEPMTATAVKSNAGRWDNLLFLVGVFVVGIVWMLIRESGL